jgi:hypothetical protein
MNPDFLVPIFLFGGSAVVLWKFVDARHRERMSIIEKGLVKEDLKYLYTRGVWKANPYSSLKWGMLAAFIGIGTLISAFISQYTWNHEDQITVGTIFLFGGLGLVVFYLIAKKKMEQDEKLNE